MGLCSREEHAEGGEGQDGEEGSAQGRTRPPLAQGAHERVVPPPQDARSSPGPEVPAQEHPARAAHGPVPHHRLVRILRFDLIWKELGC